MIKQKGSAIKWQILFYSETRLLFQIFRNGFSEVFSRCIRRVCGSEKACTGIPCKLSYILIVISNTLRGIHELHERIKDIISCYIAAGFGCIPGIYKSLSMAVVSFALASREA